MTRPDVLTAALACICSHGHAFHHPTGCDMCACDGYLRRVRRCEVCGRDVDRDPWPHHGFLCGNCDAYSMGLLP